MIQRDYEAVYLKHRPWNITASTPNAVANYLCWAQFSLRFWHFWWVSSLFQWLPTISKPVLSISLIVGRLYIRISLTTRENTLVARDDEGFMEVSMLLHVLMFWGTTCAAGRPLGLASGKLPSAHIASYEKGRSTLLRVSTWLCQVAQPLLKWELHYWKILEFFDYSCYFVGSYC